MHGSGVIGSVHGVIHKQYYAVVENSVIALLHLCLQLINFSHVELQMLQAGQLLKG